MGYLKIEYTYEVGSTVYHATPDSDKGVVVNISYSIRERQVKYEVAFGRRSEDNVWCYEEELSDSKIF